MSDEPTEVVEQDEEIQDGQPVFRGTEVPVKTLLEYLLAGDELEDFLEAYPDVSQDQAEAFLDEVEDVMARNDTVESIQ